jgi:RES domain-containing protein
MFASYPPDRENRLGARWNPPDVPAIYTSLSQDTVLAEVEYQLSMEPNRPPVRRTLYQLDVALSSVLDLSTPQALASVGLKIDELAAIDHTKCQIVGGAVEYMAHDGLLVPSARHPEGKNLVIYPNRQAGDYRFDVIESVVLFNPDTQ